MEVSNLTPIRVWLDVGDLTEERLAVAEGMEWVVADAWFEPREDAKPGDDVVLILQVRELREGDANDS